MENGTYLEWRLPLRAVRRRVGREMGTTATEERSDKDRS